VFSRIVVLTDCVDVAENEIRAKIFSELKENVLIEPAIKIRPFSVINGAFLLRLAVEAYPKDTLFYVVLNPINLQTNRIVCELNEGQIVIGRDTGVFSMLNNCDLIKKVYLLPYHEFVAFGGKNVYPFWVAKFMKQKKLCFDGLAELPVKNLIELDNKQNYVLHVDNFGLIKTSMPSNFLVEQGIHEGNKVNIFLNGNKKLEAVYSKRMMSENDGVWVIYSGSSLGGLIEVGQVRTHNTLESIGVAIGDNIRVELKRE
jgi:S-adenosylmethionine hydrolase